MARKGRQKAAEAHDVAAENVRLATTLLAQHPIFTPLLYRAAVVRREGNLCPHDGWAVVTSDGQIHIHPTRRARPDEWLYVLAHCLLHLGFGHLQVRERPREWNVACDRYVGKFLAEPGPPPGPRPLPLERGLRFHHQRLARRDGRRRAAQAGRALKGRVFRLR